MRRFWGALGIVLGVSVLAPSAWAQSWKPFQEFGFLVGSWSGGAESGQRIGGRTSRFSMEMKDSYLVSKGTTVFAAQQGIPEETTEEVAYVTYDRDKRKYMAFYFFSTGVSAVYDVEFPAEGTVRLTSSQLLNYESGARSRLTFTRKPDGTVQYTMELAPSGKDFQTFISSALAKR